MLHEPVSFWRQKPARTLLCFDAGSGIKVSLRLVSEFVCKL